MLQIFIPGVGQHENIGDIILRRQLLNRLRGHGTLHIYVGASTDDYDSALRVTDGDVLYRSFRRWYLSALRAMALGKGAYVFKPGEIQLTLLGMKEHIAMLPVAALARLRGKPVIRVGTGSRNFSPLSRVLIRPSIALSNVTHWRDSKTGDYLSGPTMPDLAFAEGSELEDLKSDMGRGLLVVSMRSDREATPQIWIDAVRTFAEFKNLRIVVVSQVIRDNPKTEELAQRLGAQSFTWAGADHVRHEQALRALYRQALLAVSDRLHVLIAAFTEGAMPAALLTDRSDKVSRHFSAAGISDIFLEVTRDTTITPVLAWLEALVQRRGALITQLGVARDDIDSVFMRVDDLFQAGISERLTAYHVGRRGNVAGGMTQVMNAYLSWSFKDFDIGFIQSRGARNPITTVGVVLRAASRILTAIDSDRSVLVVHLSQGGSFVREGFLVRLGRLRGFPVIAQLHGSSFADFARSKPKLVRSVLRRTHGIHALSKESAEVAGELAPEAQVVQIPNAVVEGTPRCKKPLIVFGGAVTHRKGVDVLLTAWENSEAVAKGWTLAIAGPVLDQDLLPSTLPKGVEMLGSVDHYRLMEVLETSRIAVLPSREEAMPMFLIEAMARRNAVVSTTVGGIPSLVSDSAGFLLEPGDAAALRDVLDKLTADEELTQKFQDGALECFRANYSADVIGPQLNDFWLSVRKRAVRGGRVTAYELKSA